MYVDHAVIYIKSGKGGSGAISFFPNSKGPCGGNGGKGGDIIFVTDTSINNLEYFRYKQHFFADAGSNGGSNYVTGKNGANMIIKVPTYTDIEIHNQHHYMLPNMKIIALKGSRGGLGNGAFKSSVQRAPKFSQPGKEGLSARVVLELKLMADIGLIGQPNAGKSSIIRCLTNSKSKVDNYAFTTINPQQGMCGSVCILDLPGITEGAHQGKGLGLKFLKHAEHCADLMLVVDASDDVISTIDKMIYEIECYQKVKMPRYLIINKIDKIKNSTLKEIYEKVRYRFTKVFLLSAILNTGVQKLKDYIIKNYEKKSIVEE